MTIVNMTKLITVRDDLNALASLMEYELPKGLILDIVANAVMHLTDVINTEADGVVEPDTRRDSAPTVGITSAEFENAVTLFCNLLKELKMEE